MKDLLSAFLRSLTTNNVDIHPWPLWHGNEPGCSVNADGGGHYVRCSVKADVGHNLRCSVKTDVGHDVRCSVKADVGHNVRCSVKADVHHNVRSR